MTATATLYRQATYWLSVHKLTQLPEDSKFEVAFAGRSNSGKSSAINAITGQKKLARTSKTPGRTQQIIFFKLDEHRNLVDLPGYGFAKVPLAVKLHWQQTLERYLHTRRCLCGLVLMMDVRHPLTEFDQEMLNWCNLSNMPVHVLLTKADKISRSKGNIVLQKVRQHLATLSIETNVQLFSALKHVGIEEVQNGLNTWLKIDN
ncbi:MAG: YihA family ribosome biogenesis GTP-binding protein [Gammaproteobacteria bacterium]|nr:MAG: YihA family ribosome biogenesis GTP-binding protein [Gammaproteobacteria bacterium]RKZ41481.1 MAG: YihA family ribosome biogenesis GTP-binding protein [Gammaproteobacteria bacterium]RKZ72605.1 MAG: YihA family ribosome biogenesis GTP-binding protein [Gammaproteobacteria bacterium]